MKTKNALTLVAALSAALFAQAGFAQASAPKSGLSTPAGPATLPSADRNPGMSTETMGDVKAKTKADAKHGQLTPAGEAVTGASGAMGGQMEHKAKVKADTKAAAKNGTLVPAGEGPDAPKK